MSAKVHTFTVGEVIATWFDTGMFGAKLLFGVVIAAGPKVYRVRWESGHTNRVEQGRTTCWLHDDWADYGAGELARIAGRLGVPVDKLTTSANGGR